MITLTCYCDKKFETDIRNAYDLAENPGLIEDIVSGVFMQFTCPACGKVLKPEFTLRFTDEKKSINLYMIPENERNGFLIAIASGDALAGFPEDSFVKPEGPDEEFTAVIGFSELAERMRLFELGLNPKVVEVIKYFYLQKAGPKGEPAIFFDHREENKLFFHIHGLKEGEIGVAGIPVSFYEKIAFELSDKNVKPAYAEIITPPYISVNKIMIDESGEDPRE